MPPAGPRAKWCSAVRFLRSRAATSALASFTRKATRSAWPAAAASISGVTEASPGALPMSLLWPMSAWIRGRSPCRAASCTAESTGSFRPSSDQRPPRPLEPGVVTAGVAEAEAASGEGSAGGSEPGAKRTLWALAPFGAASEGVGAGVGEQDAGEPGAATLASARGLACWRAAVPRLKLRTLLLLPRAGELDWGLLLVLRGLMRLVNAAGSCFRRGLALVLLLLLPLLLPMDSRSCCPSGVMAAERCGRAVRGGWGSCACMHVRFGFGVQALGQPGIIQTHQGILDLAGREIHGLLLLQQATARPRGACA